MARTPATFKEADAKRAVKAVRSAGEEVSGVEFLPDGTIRVLTAKCSPVPASPYDEWKQRNASST